MQRIWLLLGIFAAPLFAESFQIGASDVDLYERLSRLERAVHTRETVDVLARLQKMEQENAELSGRVEELQFEVRRLSKKQGLFFKEVEGKVGARAGQSSSQNQASSVASLSRQASASSLSSNTSDEDAYNNPMAALRDGRLREAKEGLLNYIRLYPKGQYAPNAHYWLGELFLKEGYFKSALQHFDEILLNHQDSHKTPDAWYKKGVTLFNSNRAKEGQEAFQKLLSTYPSSAAARLAKIYLERRE